MKKTALLVAAILMSAMPSTAMARSGEDNGSVIRCEREMPNFLVWVPCWILWEHRAGD